MSDTPTTGVAQATPDEELRRQILSPCVAKNEREWWASGTIEKLEFELNAANDRIKRLEEAIQERDKEWFQVIESILGFHPVSMTEALRIGIERIKKQKQLIKRLKETGDAMMSEPLEYTYEQWLKVRGSKP